MKSFKIFGLFAMTFVITLLGTACASSTGNLQRETARAITPAQLPEGIVITEVDRGATNVSWVATDPEGRVFDCRADDMLRRVLCVPRS